MKASLYCLQVMVHPSFPRLMEESIKEQEAASSDKTTTLAASKNITTAEVYYVVSTIVNLVLDHTLVNQPDTLVWSTCR
jgi:hypothetical protein